jgi:hypothetical protein
MSSLWGAVFIQVLDRTGPLMLNLSRTPCRSSRQEVLRNYADICGRTLLEKCLNVQS